MAAQSSSQGLDLSMLLRLGVTGDVSQADHTDGSGLNRTALCRVVMEAVQLSSMDKLTAVRAVLVDWIDHSISKGSDQSPNQIMNAGDVSFWDSFMTTLPILVNACNDDDNEDGHGGKGGRGHEGSNEKARMEQLALDIIVSVSALGPQMAELSGQTCAKALGYWQMVTHWEQLDAQEDEFMQSVGFQLFSDSEDDEGDEGSAPQSQSKPDVLPVFEAGLTCQILVRLLRAKRAASNGDPLSDATPGVAGVDILAAFPFPVASEATLAQFFDMMDICCVPARKSTLVHAAALLRELLHCYPTLSQVMWDRMMLAGDHTTARALTCISLVVSTLSSFLKCSSFVGFQQAVLWERIQQSVMSNESIHWKQATFIISSVVEFLSSADSERSKSFSNSHFYWNPENQDAIKNNWTVFVQIVTTLESTQSHIVKPVLVKFERLINAAINATDGYLPMCWMEAVFDRMFHHDRLAIRSLGALLCTRLRFPSSGDSVEKPHTRFSNAFVFDSLVPLLNTSCLFEPPAAHNPTEPPALGAAMVEFFLSLFASYADRGEAFLQRSFIEALSHHVRNVVPGIFFLQITSNWSPCMGVWREDTLSWFLNFVSYTRRSQDIVLRNTIMTSALRTLVHNITPTCIERREITPSSIIKFFAICHHADTWVYGDELWVQVSAWWQHLLAAVDSSVKPHIAAKHQGRQLLQSFITEPERGGVEVAVVPPLSVTLSTTLAAMLATSGVDDLVFVFEPVVKFLASIQRRAHASVPVRNRCLSVLTCIVQEILHAAQAPTCSLGGYRSIQRDRPSSVSNDTMSALLWVQNMCTGIGSSVVAFTLDQFTSSSALLVCAQTDQLLLYLTAMSNVLMCVSSSVYSKLLTSVLECCRTLNKQSSSLAASPQSATVYLQRILLGQIAACIPEVNEQALGEVVGYINADPLHGQMTLSSSEQAELAIALRLAPAKSDSPSAVRRDSSDSVYTSWSMSSPTFPWSQLIRQCVSFKWQGLKNLLCKHLQSQPRYTCHATVLYDVEKTRDRLLSLEVSAVVLALCHRDLGSVVPADTGDTLLCAAVCIQHTNFDTFGNIGLVSDLVKRTWDTLLSPDAHGKTLAPHISVLNAASAITLNYQVLTLALTYENVSKHIHSAFERLRLMAEDGERRGLLLCPVHWLTASCHPDLPRSMAIASHFRSTVVYLGTYGPKEATRFHSHNTIREYCRSSTLCTMYCPLLADSRRVRECIIRWVLTLSPTPQAVSPKKTSSTSTTSSFLDTFVLACLDLDADTSKIVKSYHTNSPGHHLRNRLWQMMLLLCQTVSKATQHSIYSYAMESVDSEAFVSVRFLMEWSIMLLVKRLDISLADFLGNLFSRTVRASFVCSMLLIGMRLVSTMSHADEFVSNCRLLLQHAMPMTMNLHMTARLYGASTVYALCEVLKSMPSKEAAELLNDGFVQTVDRFLHSQDEILKYVKGLQDDFFFSRFDPVREHNVEFIFVEVPRLFDLKLLERYELQHLIPNSAPTTSKTGSQQKLLAAITWTGDEEEQSLLSAHAGVRSTTEVKSLGAAIRESDRKAKQVADLNSTLEANSLSDDMRMSEAGELETEVESVEEDIQTKIDKMQDAELDALAFGDKTGAIVRNIDRERSRLIVVASLVDLPTNLGGLSRTCEIFNVGTLVLPHQKYMAMKEFKLLSVTSEMWMNFEFVPPEGLVEWLALKRSEGYAIVGVEQTAQSVPLHHHQFKQDTVLVLGAEATGIPADVLQEVRYCVEVPQFGLTRSLNVHVTASLFIYKYVEKFQVAGLPPPAVPDTE
eukprot:m.337308 g.337308  ORF g.337308 m.337308 type:complete len:1787 (+) comp16081_c1_seq1:105-5465(+)